MKCIKLKKKNPHLGGFCFLGLSQLSSLLYNRLLNFPLQSVKSSGRVSAELNRKFKKRSSDFK